MNELRQRRQFSDSKGWECWNIIVKACVSGSNSYFQSLPAQLFVLTVAAISSVSYVIGTYHTYSYDTYVPIESVIFGIFLIDYIMAIIHARHKLNYLISMAGVADLLSLAPIIAVIPSIHATWVGFLRFFRLIKVFYILKLRESTTKPMAEESALSQIHTQIWHLVMSILIFVMMSTGAVYALTKLDANSFTETMTWFDSCYFVIVTITTVGYGDITPVTQLAKALVVIVIIIGFGIIPVQAAALAQTIMVRPKYLGTVQLTAGCSHICICGIVDFELLHRFLREIFHPSQYQDDADELMIVILSPLVPTDQVIALLHMPAFRKRVSLHIGSCKSFNDLKRIKADQARAIYVMSDVVTSSLRYEEDSIFLSAISITRYIQNCHNATRNINIKKLSRSSLCAPVVVLANNLDNDINTYSTNRTMVKLTATARSRQVLLTTGVHTVLSVQEFKYGLLGASAVCPGLLAIFLSLNLNYSGSHMLLNLKQVSSADTYTKEWSGQSLFQMSVLDEGFSLALGILRFAEAAVQLYRASQGKVILVGLVLLNRTLVNPYQSRCLINESEAIFVIAKNLTEAMQYTSETGFIMEQREIPKKCRHREYLGESATCTSPAAAAGNLLKQDEKVSRKLKESGRLSVKRLNSFVASVVRGVRPVQMYSVPPTVPQVSEEGQLTGHIVLILSSGGSKDTTANILMLPIIYFLRSVRASTVIPVVVLTDRAEELEVLMAEVEDTKSGFLRNVQFVSGIGRSAEHLASCRVQFASAVVVIRAPIAGESVDESMSDTTSVASRSVAINFDRHTIITSLNLHMILQQFKMHQYSTSTICEVVHEANIRFLRQFTSASVNGFQDDEVFDWPLLTAGCVFPHTLMDALIVQTIFNSNVINFWEAVFGVGMTGEIYSNPDAMEEEKSKSQDDKSEDGQLNLNPNTSPSSQITKVKAIPGSTFGNAFEHHWSYGSITIAIYRRSQDTTSLDLLPIAIVLPPLDTVLEENDELFILT